jgi:hypothetical protein
MGQLGWRGPRWVFALAAITVFVLPPPQAEAQRGAAAQQNPVTSLFNVRIGGYVQTNVTWDSDENPDDNPSALRQFAIERGTPEERRETLRWAATRTRLFIDVRGPELWGARTRAYTEFDWDGLKLSDSTPGNTSSGAAHTPRLRHAYARFDWPVLYLTVGQTTLIFDSVVSSESEVEGVSSAHGDITAGSRNRAPQFILGAIIPIAGARLEVAGSVGRHQTDRQAAQGLNDSGARSALPAFQGLVKGSYPLFGRDAIAAVSGYWGQETLTATASRAFKDVNSEGIAVEAYLPLPSFAGISPDLRGAWFAAENMSRWNLGNAASGGGGAGLTSTTPTANPRAIFSKGWWVEANLDLPADFAVGAGRGNVEDDRDRVSRIAAGRTEPLDNTGWWLFAQWTPGPVVVELLYGRIDTTFFDTTTRNLHDSHSTAVHLVFRYRF